MQAVIDRLRRNRRAFVRRYIDTRYCRECGAYEANGNLVWHFIGCKRVTGDS